MEATRQANSFLGTYRGRPIAEMTRAERIEAAIEYSAWVKSVVQQGLGDMARLGLMPANALDTVKRMLTYMEGMIDLHECIEAG